MTCCVMCSRSKQGASGDPVPAERVAYRVQVPKWVFASAIAGDPAPRSGPTGSSIGGLWSRSATYRRPNENRCIMSNRVRPGRQPDSSQRVSDKVGAVHWGPLPLMVHHEAGGGSSAGLALRLCGNSGSMLGHSLHDDIGGRHPCFPRFCLLAGYPLISFPKGSCRVF